MSFEPAARVRVEARGRAFAIPSRQILKVMAARPLRRVPCARPEVAGLLVLEDRAIPVYRPGGILPDHGDGERRVPEKEIVVLEAEGIVAGFLVDRADLAAGPVDDSLPVMDGAALLAAAGIPIDGEASQHAAGAAGGE